MPADLPAYVPREALEIGLVLILSLFVGLEREEIKQRGAEYAFGGVRTVPILGLVSYGLALVSAPALAPWAVGFAVVGGFMLLSYFHKLGEPNPAGLATEMTALAVYTIGGLVQHQDYWIAVTIGVICVLLLELKRGLEGMTKYIASEEILTAAKFLVLSAVVLPILPNQTFTQFELNPFKIWLVVVAVSGVSFASYVLQRVFTGRASLLVSALLGGAYSSTVTTVVLARQSVGAGESNGYAGSILTACSVMYARLVILVAIFNGALAAVLAPPFAALAILGSIAGWMVYRRSTPSAASVGGPTKAPNPLELRTAFVFGAIFVAVIVITHLVREYLGRAGLFTLAAVMGVTDVDPFILGLTQPQAVPLSIGTAASAIVIAAASNNLIKAIYAYSFADRDTGRRSAGLLVALTVCGLLPLIWL